MELSINKANTFRRCQRLYYYHYVKGYRSIKEAPWLTKGKNIELLKSLLRFSNIEYVVDRIKEKIEDPYDQVDYEYILRSYDAEYEMLQPVRVNNVTGEQFYFDLPLESEAGLFPKGANFHGYIDNISTYDGQIVIVEEKTTSDPINPTSAYWKRLDLDPQITGYAWALSNVLGEKVTKVVYEVTRKPSPKISAAFNRTKQVKKTAIPIPIEEYREKVLNLLIDPPKQSVHARRLIHISIPRALEWKEEHGLIYKQILEAKKMEENLLNKGEYDPCLAYPRNQFSCDMYGGCPFRDVCANKKTVEETGLFYRKED